MLRLFSAVVASGGLSAAAAALQVDLSSVSRQFKRLEARVGVNLARRGRSGFCLSAAGKTLHDTSRQLVVALDAFDQQRRLLACLLCSAEYRARQPSRA